MDETRKGLGRSLKSCMFNRSYNGLCSPVERQILNPRDGVYNRPMLSSELLNSSASGSDNGVRWVIHYRLSL